MKLNVFISMLCLLSIGIGGCFAQDFQGNFGLGIFSGPNKLIGGKSDDAMVSGWGGINLFYGISDRLTIETNVAAGWTFIRDENSYIKRNRKRPELYFRTWLFPAEMNLSFFALTKGIFRPYLFIGGGVLVWQLRYERWNSNLFPSGWNVHGTQYTLSGKAGVGTVFPLSEHFLIDLSGRYHYLYDQNLDNVGTGYTSFTANGQTHGGIKKVSGGDINDGILELRLGLKWLFGGTKDTDNDGIIDKLDLNPNKAEDFDGFQDEDGKPDLDNDNDGILDSEDQCPNQAEDWDGFEDGDGCPDPDNDGDGIPDDKDQSPNEAEDFDGFQDKDGRPDLDNDKDGIPDDRDDCPDNPETFNGFMDEDGCPDEVPQKEEPPLEKGASLVFPEITFETGRASLTISAKLTLDNVYQMLWQHKEIIIEIRGFTDNTGGPAINRKLSQQRAQSVKNYLIGKGIEADRMIVVGFGPEKPIATNSTPEGRAKNRRIEFYRIK